MELGFLLILLGGLMNGSFATPMKQMRGWAWEHSWLAWAVSALILFPAAAAVATVPGLSHVYADSSGRALALTAMFGFVWGVSSVLFGLGVDRLGLSLGFGIIIGISSTLGALVPLVAQHPERIPTPAGLATLAGVFTVLAGVAACAAAGRLREKALARTAEKRLGVGLVICLLSALGAPAVNYGLAFGGEIVERARRAGAAGPDAVNAIWPLMFLAGFLPNAFWCGWLIARRSSWAVFSTRRPMANLFLGALMGLLWFLSNVAYGYGSQALGELGLVLGWPLFMGCIVLTANGWGAVTGEWRGAPAAARGWIGSGVALLVAGAALIGYAGSL
jgi:L-rhamnose-H+ transport protein